MDTQNKEAFLDVCDKDGRFLPWKAWEALEIPAPALYEGALPGTKAGGSWMKGFSWGFMAVRGMYAADEAFESLRHLKETGTEWIALCLTVVQDSYNSTNIRFDYNFTPTDKELSAIIDEAHRLGFKVCLKPIVNCADHLWRARISFPDEGPYWSRWFTSYNGFLCHYAEIAQETGCELFCLGCEMLGTEHREDDWRRLIGQVRIRYSGPLTYNTNHGKEDRFKCWDAVDILGTSAYYPVADGGSNSLESMLEAWKPIRENLKAVAETYKKPLLFMEIGCRSAYSCASMPWDFMHRDLAYDADEQANFYESALKSFKDEAWFAGFFWWDWSARLYKKEKSSSDTGFAIYGKKAETVLSRYYKL